VYLPPHVLLLCHIGLSVPALHDGTNASAGFIIWLEGLLGRFGQGLARVARAWRRGWWFCICPLTCPGGLVPFPIFASKHFLGPFGRIDQRQLPFGHGCHVSLQVLCPEKNHSRLGKASQQARKWHEDTFNQLIWHWFAMSRRGHGNDFRGGSIDEQRHKSFHCRHRADW
jgi:hypothetical protein